MIDRRLIAGALASVVGHLVLARVLAELPPRPAAKRPARIEVRVVQPPPKLEPPPPAPEPEPPPPPPPMHQPKQPRPAARTTELPVPAPVDTPAAPSDTAVKVDSTARPKFGITMESTSVAGATSAPVGNTTRPTPDTGGPAAPAPLAPVAAHEVTKMPLPQGRCAGKYTDEARNAGIEGVVVLDVIVDATGRTRDIQVVESLSHGLTEAAVAALRACRFTPGEKDGQPVAVRVRGFKIRFLIGDGLH